MKKISKKVFLIILLFVCFPFKIYAQKPLSVSHIHAFDTTLNPSGRGLYYRFGQKAKIYGNYAAILSAKCVDVWPQNDQSPIDPKVIFITKRVNNEWKFHSKIETHQDESILDFKINEWFIVLNKLDYKQYWNLKPIGQLVVPTWTFKA